METFKLKRSMFCRVDRVRNSVENGIDEIVAIFEQKSGESEMLKLLSSFRVAEYLSSVNQVYVFFIRKSSQKN